MMAIFQGKPFATACYKHNSIKELEEALKGPADIHDCEVWGLTAHEWREQITLALKAKRADEIA